MRVIADEKKVVIDKDTLDQFITPQDDLLQKTRSRNINEAQLEGVPMSSVWISKLVMSQFENVPVSLVRI